MLLRNARLVDGSIVDVAIHEDRIAAIGHDLPDGADETSLDLAGRLLLPAPAEPHTHLDKAFTAERVHNPTGDLIGAISAWQGYRDRLTVDDIAERAEAAARRLLTNGATAIRTHVDVSANLGVRAVEALHLVRQRIGDDVDIQIVGLVSIPTTGVAGAGNRAALADALDVGLDLVGGAPHLDEDPMKCLQFLFELAAEHGRPLDLHTDETLDPRKLTLHEMARMVNEEGFAHAVTASHCVSLGVQPEALQREVAEAVAAAGIAVVALPQTNLFLQGWQHPVAMPRGLTAIGALRDAGAIVAAGADNLQDPFNPMGRGDPFETANLCVTAAHLLPEHAYDAISNASRVALGLAPVEIAPGAPAELLAVASGSVRAALADFAGGRIVIHRGRVVAGTATTS